MNWLYRSPRVGRRGKPFNLLKIRTLRAGTDKTSSYAQRDQYLPFGRFLRKTHADELPQLWNIVRGDMRIFGWRPEEAKTWKVLPEHMRETLGREKPGLLDLASVVFFDEEKLLQDSHDPARVFWERIRPMKFVLQCAYMENRSWLLNGAIVWAYLKKLVCSLWKK